MLVECEKIIKSYNGLTFDVALPKFQDKLWAIAKIYNTTGPELLNLTMKRLIKNNINLALKRALFLYTHIKHHLGNDNK